MEIIMFTNVRAIAKVSFHILPIDKITSGFKLNKNGFFLSLSCPPPSDENKKLKVTMVGWDLTDKLVVTAVSDYTV